MADAEDRAVEPQEARRRIPRWLAVVLVLAVVALAAVGLAAVFADDDEDPTARWEECAERVDPPADRSARLDEFSAEEDDEAAAATRPSWIGVDGVTRGWTASGRPGGDSRPEGVRESLTERVKGWEPCSDG